MHEALLNLAIDPELPFWLMCPYDEHLGSEVLAEAGRSHPAISTAASYHGSPSYGGHAHAQEIFTAALPAITGRPAETFVAHRMNSEATRECVMLQAVEAGLWSEKVIGLTDVVRRLTVNSLQRGAERVHIGLWNGPESFICELVDNTVIDDLLVGRRGRPSEQDSLWYANNNCDLVQVRSNENGTTIRLHMRT